METYLARPAGTGDGNGPYEWTCCSSHRNSVWPPLLYETRGDPAREAWASVPETPRRHAGSTGRGAGRQMAVSLSASDGPK